MEEKVRCERSSSLLIVEDDESQLRTLTAIMQGEGFDVIGCSTAAEAIEHLKHLDTGVVVLDLRLPDLSGTQLLDRLADATDRIRVIINTAYSSYESAKDALNLGAFAYVEKAGDPEELLRYVHRAFQASLRSYADELETAVAERTHELLQANESLKEEITERELTEEALRASEERYRELFENAGEGIITLDLDGRITGANRLVEEYGFNRAELNGRRFFDFVPGYDKVRSVSDFQALVAGSRVQGQMNVITPKGIITVEYRDTPIVRAGEIIGVQAILTDITERKKAEDVIAKLAKFPAEDPNPVLRISGRGTVIYANKASANLLKVWGCRVGESVTDRWNELVMDSLSSSQSQQTEVQCDGRIFSLTFAPVVDANYVNIYGMDITEHKKAEEEILNLAKFLSENPYPVLRISHGGVVLYANAASTSLLRENNSGIGQPAPQRWQRLVGRVLASDSVGRIEEEHKRRVFAFRAVPVTDAGYVNFYGVDMTERKKAKDRLLAEQAKLKAMASKILLTEERERQRLAVGLHDEVCQKLVLTKLALESSLNLVSDSKVLASLRITCGAIGETIEQADSLTFELSNPVLRQLGFVIALEKYLTEEIRQKYGIVCELEGDEQLSTLPDEIKNCLFRVTRELLTNVVKHAHARKVKVSARESQSQICVRVQDDGVGFKESQAGSKVSQTARFGLFSIREQLEYLGGHLEIESKPGRGTTATVVVPLRGKATV